MAGRLRIKISPEHVEPFWMFVDREESPLIVDIQNKIQQRLQNVAVTSMLLDGCLLPADETSELLRDNDLVNVSVIATECEDQPGERTYAQCKRRKRKHSVEAGECPESDRQVDLAVENLSTLYAKQKKKSKKEELQNVSGGRKCRREKEKKYKKKTGGHIYQKGKEKKQKKKTVAQPDKTATKGEVAQQLSNTANGTEGIDASQRSTPVSANRPNRSQNETNAETPQITGKISEKPEIVNGTPVCEGTNAPVIEKRKRRRRLKKKENTSTQPETGEGSAKTLSLTKETAELRLPLWQQAQNKKILFSSEEEAVDESEASTSTHQVNSQEVTDKSQVTGSQASAQTGISDYNSSFSESYPPASSINLTIESFVQREISKDTSDAVTSDAGAELGTIPQVSGINMPVNSNGSTSCNAPTEGERCTNEENEKDEWYRKQQHQSKLTEERNFNRRCPSELNKSISPVHQFKGGHYEMSPEQQGVPVAPYVTARRLSNGAMVYTRSSVSTRTDCNTASSPFKKPATYAPAKISPGTLGKKQQLETINTNNSVVVQNPPTFTPDVSGTKSEVHRNGNSSAVNGERPVDNQETIFLIPVRQEYSQCADLTAAPKVGDLIAYKVLEMGEDYTPGISEYKEAEVLGYDVSTQNVTVRLLHPRTKKKAPGKFDLPDENPAEEEVTLELSSMFEPKVISSR